MKNLSENSYKKVRHAGASSLVIGIVLIVGGITLGTLSLVNGGKLISTNKSLRELL
jgi:hypothetical protein